MKDKIILIAIFTVFMSVLPLFAAANETESVPPNNINLGISSPETSSVQSTEEQTEDIIFNVFNTATNEIMTLKGRDYIIHVVAAEMPASFEEEALKAQTVAAFTYALNRKTKESDGTHEGCELCTDSTHCKAYTTDEKLKEKWGDNFNIYYNKITNAVNEVYGEYMSYENKPISAVFHSLSSGITESAKDIWGHDHPYLVSVDSSSDKTVNGYETQVVITKKDLQSIMEKYSDNASFKASPEKWFEDFNRSNAGGVINVKACGIGITGAKARELFNLRSINFSVEYSSKKESFTFTVRGYGHGVGMSQFGANSMAKEGVTYREILLHYYTGVTIEPAEKGIREFS